MDISGFIASLRTSSAETRRAYRQDLEKFEAFLRAQGLRVNQVKPSTIDAFVEHLSATKGRTAGAELAPATVARKLAVLSSFFDFLADNSEVPIRNPVTKARRPKVNNELPRDVDEQTLASLVEGITDSRDRAIVLLFLYSGLRLSELQHLNKDTITLKRRTLPDGTFDYIGIGEVVGKGGKRRTFLAGLKAMQAVAQYVSERGFTDSEPALFISNRKRRMTCRAIQLVVDKWCKRLGLAHIHAHQLRHSFATRNVNAGMSSAVLKELMGHSNLTTTQRYYHMREERLTREYFSVMEYVTQCQAV